MNRPARRITLAAVPALVVASALAVTLVAGRADAQRGPWGIGPGVAKARPAATTPARPVPSPVRTSSPASSPASAPASSPASSPASDRPAASGPFLATLATRGDMAAKESQAGLKVAMLEFSWKALEPKRGVFDSGYASWMSKQMAAFRNAGMQVTLGLGLHYAPQWALDLAGGRLVDQYGRTSAQADLIFNQNLRQLADEYLRKIDQVVGLENFWAVRITSASLAELLYPAGNGYWAYSDGAQNGASKPPSMAANPMPGWKPGQPATAQQRDAWARWYLGALDDVADWQMDTVGALGFRGYFQIVTPGQGLRPTQYDKLVSNGLSDGLLGRGAVWHILYAGLRGREHVTAYVSSLADGSAENNTCQASDSGVALDSGTAYYFSAPRYIARIAAINGFTVAGEVPGYPSSASGRAFYQDTSDKGLLATAHRQAASCGFLGMYWAHDDQVANGTMQLSSLAKYSTPAALAPAAAR